jgi:hypothetical protein
MHTISWFVDLKGKDVRGLGIEKRIILKVLLN